jgi:ABC-type nitrate/sulfonate/bicarbonate transport system permease component
MSLAISLFVTIPVIYSGFKDVEVDQFKPARTFGAGKARLRPRSFCPAAFLQ